MIIETKSQLKKFNYRNELRLYLLNLEKIDFHEFCTFPYNILIMVQADDGSDESFIRCQQNGEYYSLRQGKYYFIPCGMTVEYCLRPNITYYTFHVGLEVYPGIDLFSSQRKIDVGENAEWVPLIAEAYAEGDEFLALCRFRSVLLDFFIVHWPGEASLRAKVIPDEFRSLMRDIQTQVDAALTVDSLARRMHMTPEAFSRKFHRVVRITPKAFLVQCLIEKIAAMLCNSGKNIREIAEELKFSSEFYLSKFFKKSMGIPPSIYRSLIDRRGEI